MEHVGTSHIQLLRAECGMETRIQQLKFAQSSRCPRTSNAGVSADCFRRDGNESCHRAPASSFLAVSPRWRRRESYSTAQSGSPPTLDKNDRSFIEETYPTELTLDSLRNMKTKGNNPRVRIFPCASEWLIEVYLAQIPIHVLPARCLNRHIWTSVGAAEKYLWVSCFSSG